MTDNTYTNRAEQSDAPPSALPENLTATIISTWNDTSATTRQQPSEPNQIVFNNPFANNAQEGQPARQPEQAQPAQPGQGGDRPPAAQPAPAEGPAPAQLTAQQINDLIHGRDGLGSTTYRNREAAQLAIQQAGVNALPALMAALRGNEMPLETRRRCEQAMRRMVGNGYQDVLTGMRSPDAAVAQSCEILLSRQTTEDLLRGSTFQDLTPANRRQFNELIRTRLTQQQLEALTYGNKGDLMPANEQSLRVAVAASEVLGTPNQAANFQLGAILMERNTPADRAQAERYLQSSLNGAENPSMSASARRMLAARAFERGDNVRGIALAGEALTNLGQAAQNVKDELAQREFRALADLTQRTAQNGQQRLTDEQRTRLGEITTQSTQQGNDFDRAHQAYLESMRGGKKQN